MLASNTTLRTASRGRTIVSWILQILAALAFLAAGSAKLTSQPMMIAVFQKVGIGQWFRFFTGAIEVCGAGCLLLPRTAFYASVLLAVVMIGATIAHLTVLGGPPVAPLGLLVITSVIAWLRRP